jgi:hypothetical protein
MQKTEEINIKEFSFFFIIGRARSGTTMLRSMFDAHPNVIIPFESPYIFLLRRKYSKIKIWSKEKLLEFYDDLFNTTWKFQAWDINKEKLKEDLLKCEGENDYFTICKTVHFNYISVFKKENIKVIGDKSPKYALKIDTLVKLFPEARFIHIIRDYRDQLHSSLKVDFLDSIVPEILYQWKYSAELLNRFKKSNPDKIFSIRYEDLVKDPAKGFSQMCNFLNIPYFESSLDFYKKENEIKNQINLEIFNRVQTSLFNPIDDSRIDRWKGNLNDKQLRMADLIAGKTGEMYDYPRSEIKWNFRTSIEIYLKLTLVRFYYFYQFILQHLPVKNRRRIKNLVPKLSVIYYKLFPNDKINTSK